MPSARAGPRHRLCLLGVEGTRGAHTVPQTLPTGSLSSAGRTPSGARCSTVQDCPRVCREEEAASESCPSPHLPGRQENRWATQEPKLRASRPTHNDQVQAQGSPSGLAQCRHSLSLLRQAVGGRATSPLGQGCHMLLLWFCLGHRRRLRAVSGSQEVRTGFRFCTRNKSISLSL